MNPNELTIWTRIYDATEFAKVVEILHNDMKTQAGAVHSYNVHNWSITALLYGQVDPVKLQRVTDALTAAGVKFN